MTSKKISELVLRGLPLQHIPVIDFHCHLGSSSEYEYMPRSSPEQVISCMDRFGVDHIVTFTINVTTDPTPGNDLQCSAAHKYPQRISALTMLHSGFPQDWKSILEQGYKQGSRGIKLISQYQAVEESTVDWSEAFDYAHDKNWVVLHHNWEHPERLEYWAKNFPKLIFIIGHASVDYKKLVGKYENVYQCTCASFVSRYFSSIKAMLNSLPVEKILYGSDALDLDFGTGIGPIAFANIPEHQKEQILGANALKLMERLAWNIPIKKKYTE